MININYDYDQVEGYLTEELLGKFLNEFLPDCEIYHDKIVPSSGIKNRPDYRIEKLKLIIEFNGKFHYTNPDTILNDYKKKEVYTNMGYKVVIIPYWIQLKSVVIQYIFKNIIKLDLKHLKDYNNYEIGFHDKKCPLPSTFCELGNKKLMEERKEWDYVIDKLYKYFDYSLLEKIFERDSFIKVSNETIMPYFINFWESGGSGFGWLVQTERFPGINKEIKMLKQIKEFRYE